VKKVTHIHPGLKIFISFFNSLDNCHFEKVKGKIGEGQG
jgi:hypothetical protein